MNPTKSVSKENKVLRSTFNGMEINWKLKLKWKVQSQFHFEMLMNYHQRWIAIDFEEELTKFVVNSGQFVD